MTNKKVCIKYFEQVKISGADAVKKALNAAGILRHLTIIKIADNITLVERRAVGQCKRSLYFNQEMSTNYWLTLSDI